MLDELGFRFSGAGGHANGEAAANGGVVAGGKSSRAFSGVARLAGSELEAPAGGFRVLNFHSNLLCDSGGIGQLVHQNLQPASGVGVCRREGPMASGTIRSRVVGGNARNWRPGTGGEGESRWRPEKGAGDEKLENSGGLRHISFTFIFGR